MLAASKLDTIESLERRLASSPVRLRLSKGLWPRYMRGEVMPQGAKTPSRSSLIARVDTLYPGTGAIFYSPLWDLMDFDRLLGPKELVRMYLQLDEWIWTKFVAHKNTHDLARIALAPYWHRPLSVSTRTVLLERLHGMDGLSACMIEARMGYLRQDIRGFFDCLRAGSSVMKQLASTTPFAYKRMRSALLLLEGLWLLYMGANVMSPPHYLDTPEFDYSKALEWAREWSGKADHHARTLDTSSLKVFKTWRKDCWSGSLARRD